MSREIRFRAYHTKRKEWCFGYEKLGGFSLFGEVTIGGGFDVPILELKHLDIMQSTGLKDKNGVEIYEGDVLFHAIQGRRVVYYPFRNSVASFGLKCVVNGFKNTLQDADRLYEVIGNIHENPELMEGK